MKIKRLLSCLLITAILISSVPSVFAEGDGGGKFTFSTRSGTYTYNVGDTFTYRYWLELTPDIMDYAISYSSRVSELYLKEMLGNIRFDTDRLEVVSKSVPNVVFGLAVEMGDTLAQTPLNGTVLDFTYGGLAFYAKAKTEADKTAFRDKAVAVEVKFRVLEGNEGMPDYIRTRFNKLVCTTDSGTEITVVHREQSTFIPYTAYETVDNEQPTVVLNSFVDDVGFDVRYLDVTGTELTNLSIRPSAGASVIMYGFTTNGRYEKFVQKYNGEHTVWFYDVPYGQYYVECAFLNEYGDYYSTPDPEKAEHVNVPATGECQSLWLVKTEPDTVMPVEVEIEWEGDNGYCPARPEYLKLDLVNNKGSVECSHILHRSETHEEFVYAEKYDSEGVENTWRLGVYVVNVDSSGLYTEISAEIPNYKKEIINEDNHLYLKLIYTGDPSALGEPSTDGHFWKMLEGTGPTCTEAGNVTYICEDCHRLKYEYPPALGHDMETIVVEPTATECGYTKHTCKRCGYEEITDETDPISSKADPTDDVFNTATLTAAIASDTEKVIFGKRSSYTKEIAGLEGTTVSDKKFIRVYQVGTTCYILNESNGKIIAPSDMSGLFKSRSKLTEIVFKNIDTSRTTDMSSMFYACIKLTELNLGSFNTSNVTNMKNMFSACIHLKTVYVSSRFVTDNVETSDGMFSSCLELTGGNGTKYASGKTNKTYAVIDKAASEGYFTSCGVTGDTNGDGDFDASDLLRLKKYLLNLDVEIDADNADVNGDGTVNAADLLRMKKVLTGSASFDT